MLSCHPDPFKAFVSDLQIAGLDVHLYRGPNAFGTVMRDVTDTPLWWDDENVYFLAGVRPGLEKRAADSDVLKRGMFTLDFDIRKEMQGGDDFDAIADRIICALEHHPLFGKFRYIVLSGNGMHVHYFGKPVEVAKEKWVAGMKTIFQEVADITPIPPDFGCANAGRIMRMPGSWNCKIPGEKKPVEVIVWMPEYSVPPLSFVQERGKLAIQERDALRAQEQKEFAESGKTPSTVIEAINEIPIEQVVAQLLGCTVSQTKKDGGMRFKDEKGVERGFFKHHLFNVIVHEGTSLFEPPAGVGYNCLGLVKVVEGLETGGAIRWFAKRSRHIREAREKEQAAWAKEQQQKAAARLATTLIR